ncbi:MAG: hypothetical protein A2X84_11015 [Desulfuromonadaceae bacterium GWC2_58_13]|nr:MAG: hypothetical protein A2X84_11015 [Desulfuromonadaceae bacterium GWC2_58_13]
MNRADAEALAESEIDERLLRLSAGIHWDLSPEWGTSLEYQFVQNRDRVEEFRSDRHLVAVRLLYRMPLWD